MTIRRTNPNCRPDDTARYKCTRCGAKWQGTPDDPTELRLPTGTFRRRHGKTHCTRTKIPRRERLRLAHRYVSGRGRTGDFSVCTGCGEDSCAIADANARKRKP